MIQQMMRLALPKSLMAKKALLRILILTILFTGIGVLVLWDYYRVERDFSELKTLLSDTRHRAMSKNKTLVTRFVAKQVTITDTETGKVMSSLTIPTLHQVNYDSTLGDDMIVFDGHGASKYKREHGGDLRLKSWLGFRKNIAVNCTGLVTEGVYPGG